MIQHATLKRDPSLGSKSGHRKIFTNATAGISSHNRQKQQSKLLMLDLPNCYFHKLQKITKFCQCKECTLPLCAHCEQIHLSEHQKQHTRPIIKPYIEIRRNAYEKLQKIIQLHTQNKTIYYQRIQKQQQKMISIIQEYFSKLLRQLDQKYCIKQEILNDIREREQKIRRGSIKSLIQYYSQDYRLPQEPKLSVNNNSNNTLNFLKNTIFFNSNITNPHKQQYHQQQQQPYQIYPNQSPFVQQVAFKADNNKQVFSTPLSNQKLAFVSPIEKLCLDTNFNNNHNFSEDQNLKLQQEPEIEFKRFESFGNPLHMQKNSNEYDNRHTKKSIDEVQNIGISTQPSHRQILYELKSTEGFKHENYNKPHTANQFNNFNNKNIINDDKPFQNLEKGDWRKVVEMNNQNLFKYGNANINNEDYIKQNHQKERPGTSVNPKIFTPEEIKAIITPKPSLPITAFQAADRNKNRSLDNRTNNHMVTIKNQEPPIQRNIFKQPEYASRKPYTKQLTIGQGHDTKRSNFDHNQQIIKSAKVITYQPRQNNYQRQRLINNTQVLNEIPNRVFDRNAMGDYTALINPKGGNQYFDQRNTGASVFNNLQSNVNNKDINKNINQYKGLINPILTQQKTYDIQHQVTEVLPPYHTSNLEYLKQKNEQYKMRYQQYKQRNQQGINNRGQKVDDNRLKNFQQEYVAKNIGTYGNYKYSDYEYRNNDI